jgi:hypothetical protein
MESDKKAPTHKSDLNTPDVQALWDARPEGDKERAEAEALKMKYVESEPDKYMNMSPEEFAKHEAEARVIQMESDRREYDKRSTERAAQEAKKRAESPNATFLKHWHGLRLGMREVLQRRVGMANEIRASASLSAFQLHFETTPVTLETSSYVPADWRVTLGEVSLHIVLDPTLEDEDIEFFGEITVLSDRHLSQRATTYEESGPTYYHWVVFGTPEGQFFEVDASLQPCDNHALHEMLEAGFKPNLTSFAEMVEKGLNDLMTLAEGQGYLDRKPPAFACQLRPTPEPEKIFEKLGTSLEEIKRRTMSEETKRKILVLDVRVELLDSLQAHLKDERRSDSRKLQIWNLEDQEILELKEKLEEAFSIDRKRALWLDVELEKYGTKKKPVVDKMESSVVQDELLPSEYSNTVKISITGATGSGKSTVAAIVAGALRAAGLTVEHLDDKYAINRIREDENPKRFERVQNRKVKIESAGGKA